MITNKEYKKHYFKNKAYKSKFLKCKRCDSKVFFNGVFYECCLCSYEF